MRRIVLPPPTWKKALRRIMFYGQRWENHDFELQNTYRYLYLIYVL